MTPFDFSDLRERAGALMDAGQLSGREREVCERVRSSPLDGALLREMLAIAQNHCEFFRLRSLEEPVVRAFLATTSWVRLVKGARREEMMSDQARRLGILLAQVTFGRGKEGLWVRDQEALAAPLEIDGSDGRKAFSRLRDWELMKSEPRAGGQWLQLCPARITLHERAQRASGALLAVLAAHDAAIGHPCLIEPAIEERRDGGFGPAMAEADRDEALRGVQTWSLSALLMGPGSAVPAANRAGESPPRRGGDSPARGGESPAESDDPRGRVPRATHAGTHAGISNRTDQQIYDSGSSLRGGAEGGSSAAPARFRDGEKNYVFERLTQLDREGELRQEICRRTWIGRIRDHSGAVQRAVDLVREEQRDGRLVSSPLGRVFIKAREMAKAAGKVMRMLMT